MAKVYATVPGAEVQIPPFGVATNDRPCLVPPAVAEELAHAEGLRVEPDDPAPSGPWLKDRVKSKTILAPLDESAAPSEKE